MRSILIFGAGKSSSSLVNYLLEKSGSESLELIVADISPDNAKLLVKDHPKGRVVQMDIFQVQQ